MNNKEAYEKLVFLMEEMEKLLQDNEALKHLNSKLIERVKSGGYFGFDEYHIMIDMIVQNEMKYEEELYFYRKLNSLKGSFEHECFF
jgi:hypothetical protein